MKLTLLVLAATIAAFPAGGCNRPDPGAQRKREAAKPATASAQEAEEMERRPADVEREWEQGKARLTADTSSAAAAVRAGIDEDVAAAREAIAELRTTTAQNWWERQERQLDRAAATLTRKVRSVAQSWTPPRDSDTGAAGTDWTARRDALVARLERQMRDMEQALQSLDPRDASRPDVAETRLRLEQMRDDTERLRTASESEWWDVTTARVRAALDRLDAAIDRIAEGRV